MTDLATISQPADARSDAACLSRLAELRQGLSARRDRCLQMAETSLGYAFTDGGFEVSIPQATSPEHTARVEPAAISPAAVAAEKAEKESGGWAARMRRH